MRRKIYFLIESVIKIFSNLSRIRFLQNLKFNLGNANSIYARVFKALYLNFSNRKYTAPLLIPLSARRKISKFDG